MRVRVLMRPGPAPHTAAVGSELFPGFAAEALLAEALPFFRPLET